jgi:hypothetical protein
MEWWADDEFAVERRARLRRGRLVLLHLIQELVNPLGVFLRVVEREVKLRETPELEPLDQLAPNESGSMLEGLDGVGLLFSGSLHVDEDARVLHIRLDTDFADHDHALEPRVFQFTRQHGVDFVSDFLAHTFVTVIGWTHFRTRGTD